MAECLFILVKQEGRKRKWQCTVHSWHVKTDWEGDPGEVESA